MTETTLERGTVLVYDPTAEGTDAKAELAERALRLDGKVVGLLDNTKDRVEVLLTEVQALLEKDFPRTEFRYFRKESVSGAGPELLDKVAECDVVVTAIGD